MQATLPLSIRRLRPAVLLAALTGLAVIAVAVVALTSTNTGPASVAIGPEATGSTVALARGGTLMVTLPANPSTGYSWVVPSLDAKVLTQSGEPEFTADGGLLGAGGVMTFRFEAVGEGETDLRLDYLRPWEDEPPIDTFEAKVTVR